MELKKLIVSDQETIKEVLFTSEEAAEWELLNTKATKGHLDKVAEQEAKEAARQSALDKLAALGLSVEEISAITGA